MRIRFLGHACFSLNSGGKEILFDPFISGNELAKGIDIGSLHPNYILLSHGHMDHVLDAERIAHQSGAVVVSNFEIVSWYQALGCQGHPMNIGGSWKFDWGTVKMVNAVHSSVLPDGTYAGNPGGFVLRSEGTTIYYAGDTALFGDMKLIGEMEKPDIGIFPIGDNFTMGIEDAATAAKFSGVKRVIAMHFDTFGYIKIDHAVARNTFEAAGIELIIPEIGQEINLN